MIALAKKHLNRLFNLLKTKYNFSLKSDKSQYFKGHFDRIQNDTLYGWAYIPRDPGLKLIIEVFAGSKLITSGVADAYRPDLFEAKIGDGFHGFEIKISTEIQNKFREKPNTDWKILVNRKYLLASMPCPYSIYDYIKSLKRCQDLLFSNCYHVKNITNKNTYKKRGNGAYILSNLQKNLLASKNHTHYQKTTIVTPYHDYTKRRMRGNKSIDTTGYEYKNEKQRLKSLLWILERYSKMRGEYRTPFSSSDIDFLNKEVEFPWLDTNLSLIHVSYLNKVSPELNLFKINPVLLEKLIFDWVYSHASSLHSEDCLIPSSYYQFLSSFSNKPFNQGKYKICRFFELIYNKDTALNFLDLNNKNDRYSFFLIMVMNAISKPLYLQFIPNDVKREIFNKNSPINIEKICSSLSFLSSFSFDNFIDEYKTYLSQKDFSFKENEFTTKAKCGNRLFSATFDREQFINSDIVDVQVIGPFEKASGLGQASRLSALCLEKSGLNVNRVNFDLDNPSPIGFSENTGHNPLKKARINLIHLNAESLPAAIAYMPDVFSDAYNIGYFFWELNTPAECHQLALDLVNEIWVSAEYGVTQYSPFTDKPVKNVGMTYEPLQTQSKSDLRAKINNTYNIDIDDTVFLTSFDSFSFIQRKNPVAVVKAFLKAFPKEEHDKVKLIVKTQNRGRVMDPVQIDIWTDLDNLMHDDNRILLINETLNYEEVLELKKASDCYISLHKSEGWGFGIIEAMALSVPVITTNYSGNLEFCSDKHSWLVDGNEVFLDEKDYIFVKPGQKWFEVDINKAAAALTECFENKKLRQLKAKRANKYIKNNFDISSITARYQSRIKEILAERN